MMRQLLFHFLLALAVPVSAQSWCPPGATWIFQPTNFVVVGANYVTCAGDTTIDGITGYRLNSSGYYYTTDGVDLITLNNPNYGIIAEVEDVLLTWSPFLESWDTLFWMGAQIGDHWRPPFSELESSIEEKIIVLEADTINMAGVDLRRLNVEQLCMFEPEPFVNWFGDITERVGYTTPLHIPPTCGTLTDFWTFTCYTDDQIEYGWPCEITLNTPISSDRPSLSIFPNPGTDHFTLQLPPGQHDLQLFDALGRSVMRTMINSDQAMIDTRSLPSGMYHIQIANSKGSITAQKWVKE